jgi:hypothetical protein
MSKQWEVIVGNVGRVLVTDSSPHAWLTYDVYVLKSQRNEGRVGGENVTLLCDGEIKAEAGPDPLPM